MHARSLVVGAALLTTLASCSVASAGWVIQQAVTGSAAGTQQIVLQSNRIKTVVLEPDGRPSTAFIVDLNTDTIIQVNYAERTYVSASFRDYVDTMRGRTQQASAQVAEATRQMEVAMKEMPPEQRRVVEQMMRAHGGGAPRECRELAFDVRATREQATIAGYRAVRHDVVADGAAQSQVWVARDLTAWREIDPTKLQRLAAEMTRLAACAPAANGAAAAGAWRTAGEGYPMRTVVRSGETIEVTKVESRPVSPSEFQAPAGFARKPLNESLGH